MSGKSGNIKTFPKETKIVERSGMELGANIEANRNVERIVDEWARIWI